MKVFFGTLLAMLGITLFWGFLKLGRWSAPLSGLVGLIILDVGGTIGHDRAALFGGGLLLFSVLVFGLSHAISR